MCSGRAFPAWQADAIRKLADVSGVEIALLIIRDGHSRTAPSRYAKLADLPHLMWTLFNKGYVERRSAASRRPWEAHFLNPVKTDIRSSRPAGTPFSHEGELYRPAQDGSSSYGGSVTITRVDELTPERFREVAVATISPSPSDRYKDGIHTISAAGSRTVVDGRRDVFILASATRQLRARVDRIFGKGD